MTVVSFSRAYRSFRGGSGRLHTRLDTPPLINRRHPDSCMVRRRQHNIIAKAGRRRMGHQLMSSVSRRRLAVAATAVAFFLSGSARAAEPDLDRFKTEIDAFLGRLGPSSNGAVEWVGSDPYELRRDGEVLLAIIENARLS